MHKQFILLCLMAWLTTQLRAQDLPYELVTDVRIAMRDGTKLAGHLSYPKTGKPVPVLLRLNCYARPTDIEDNKFIFNLSSQLGYSYAEIYIRGVEKSEGTIEPFEHDVNDAYDVIDWLSKQSWCNGDVAMGGGSYLGYTQWAALKNPHPALKTIVPMVAAAPGIDVPLLNGTMSNSDLKWLSLFNGPYCDDQAFDDLHRWRKLFNTYYTKGIAANRLDSLDDHVNPLFQKWLDHPTYDTYWSDQMPSTEEDYRKINIPVLTITGFFDSDQRGAMHYYTMHHKYGLPESVNNHYLLIGPYHHFSAQGARHFAKYHYYRFDSTAYVNKILLNVGWYDHILKGKPAPSLLKDKVNVYVIGAGWRHASSLGKMAKDTLSFYCHAATSHQLLSSPLQKTTRASLPFDSNEIADTLDANFTYRGTPFLINENFPLAEDGNENYLQQKPLLYFDSEPAHPFDLIGSPVADLYLEVKGIKDADIEIQYYEVTAEGKSYPLSTMRQRLSAYQNPERKILLEEGKIHHLKLTNSFFIGKRIAKDSKIRFVLKVVNEAGSQKNYGSGKEVSSETKRDARRGSIVIHTGKKYKSAIHLPGSRY